MKRPVFFLSQFLLLFAFLGLIVPISSFCKDSAEGIFLFPTEPIRHTTYDCKFSPKPLTIDGNLSPTEWETARWTNHFKDIEGDSKEEPRFNTRVKMLWDSTYFYIAAHIEEPHIWAKLTERDAVIFYDNDFEVFIDPDGDTHEYYELELNAFNTVWDLFLVKPYRDGAPVTNNWDINGLLTAVYIDGTLNNPKDIDMGWSVEIAIPWKVLSECAHKSSPPKEGDVWRVNFSRVQWKTDVINGEYVKQRDSESGKILPEDNWVWSPQGIIAMHYPEMWGYVRFQMDGASDFAKDGTFWELEKAKWLLRKVYYAQKAYRGINSTFTSDLSSLDSIVNFTNELAKVVEIITTFTGYEAILKYDDSQTIHIDHTGDIWTTRNQKTLEK
ncbi:MAG: carbohydrate-binding family 9-like protein [SAR324 cluster bacterium]|nr:carbohydrate-binding family 9-like protein [SAR324 cluster bacterium]